MPDLHVAIKQYTGPLDLLLFLVRRAEVDIHNLPVADVAERYVAELQKMERVDLEFAGEYLVLAAQLIKLKSEMVLHQAQRGGKGQDPRESLVAQLLEYKRFRDMALQLGERQMDEARYHGRPSGLIPDAEADDIFLDDISVYHLYREQARLMREITSSQPYRINLDDRPIEEFIRLILLQLEASGKVDFDALGGRQADRQTVIGNFLAILELVKQQKIEVEQEGGSIRIRTANPDAPQKPLPQELEEAPQPRKRTFPLKHRGQGAGDEPATSRDSDELG
ncbi:MAG: segregation/condensation protein A [Planctomycetaceae bacterium]|nr:segregation/condensation protein A [Planctomycetaceae bacterium]